MFVDLGGLRAFKSGQRYLIPAGVNLNAYQSVIIWCERFGVLISPADLKTEVAAR
jgi:Electron transfer DM13